MKKRKRIRKKSSMMKKLISKDSVLKSIIDRVTAALLIAVASWFIGILTNQSKTAPIIKQLESDNADLSWGIDYFR